jgi:hypothetical protein
MEGEECAQTDAWSLCYEPCNFGTGGCADPANWDEDEVQCIDTSFTGLLDGDACTLDCVGNSDACPDGMICVNEGSIIGIEYCAWPK